MTRTSLRWLPLSLLLVSSPAAADVVEPGFVETCTLERVQAEHAGQTCIACGTYYAEATRCDDELREGGYTQVCRSRGASVWTQIGCRDGAAPPATTEPAPTPPPATTTPPTTNTPSAAPAETSSGCSASTHAPSASAAMLALAALALISARTGSRGARGRAHRRGSARCAAR